MNARKPNRLHPQDGKVLNPRLGSDYNTVEVHNFGRYPDTKLHTHDGDVTVDFIAPNGRAYRVHLVGNRLHVAATEGGIYVRPKADNLVEVVNLTPFERDVEDGIYGVTS